MITNKEPPDNVLDELHATRRRLLDQHGGVAGLAAFLRREEEKSPARLEESVPNATENQGAIDADGARTGLRRC